MKYEGCYSLLTEDRNTDLLRAFDDCIKDCGPACDIGEIIQRVINSPAKRFWVTARRAYEVIYAWHFGKPKKYSSNLIPTRKEMFDEIYRRSKEIMEADGKNLREAVETAVRTPAPKFYLTPGSAKVILSRIHHDRMRLV